MDADDILLDLEKLISRLIELRIDTSSLLMKQIIWNGEEVVCLGITDLEGHCLLQLCFWAPLLYS